MRDAGAAHGHSGLAAAEVSRRQDPTGFPNRRLGPVGATARGIVKS